MNDPPTPDLPTPEVPTSELPTAELLASTGSANVFPFLGVGSLFLASGVALIIGRQRRGTAARR